MTRFFALLALVSFMPLILFLSVLLLALLSLAGSLFRRLDALVYQDDKVRQQPE
jgi:hypothetical protein